MKTPAGSECKYFYGDYYRGRAREECCLLAASTPPQPWRPDMCKTCPAPGILRANACEHVRLNARLVRSLMTGFKRRVAVTAFCEKAQRRVAEPQIGCGECHPLPPVFEVKK